MPLLDPRRWTPRHHRFLYTGLLVATVAGLIAAVRDGPQIGAAEGLRAVLAAAFGMGLVGLALSLRGVSLPGFLVGLLFITAGMLSWTYTGPTVWALLGVEGVLFAIWTFPWLRDLARLPRLGTAWLGLAYWFLGIIGAGLVLRPGVAMARVAYAGLFALGALAVVTATRKAGKDLSVGIVAAFAFALGALLLVGSGNVLDNVHTVPDNAWGAHMRYRFWGGPGLLYHPNSIALAVVVVAVRIGADRAFERWQRYAVLVAVTVILLLVNSRTGLVYLAAATVVYGVLTWRGRHSLMPRERDLDTHPPPRAAWWAALLPILLVVVGIGSGGPKFLGAQRYDNGANDVTSGRWLTWVQVWKEFHADDVAQQVFGDASNARATVRRPHTGVNPALRPQLTTDNAVVGALRRGGILGVLAFLLGLGLMLWHAMRGVRLPGGDRYPPPIWFTVAAVGSVPTIASADWLLGGTGGTLWIFLLAGEAYLLFSAADFVFVTNPIRRTGHGRRRDGLRSSHHGSSPGGHHHE